MKNIKFSTVIQNQTHIYVKIWNFGYQNVEFNVILAYIQLVEHKINYKRVK